MTPDAPQPPGRPLPLLVVLLGPTGSGKTALALALAEQFQGEILSCDSVAVYRGMDIGSAKPSAEERARVPHHLIDIADPGRPYSAGEYSRDARRALAEVVGRGRLPIVTGGTGLYLRALLQGLFPGPLRSEPLRERLRRSAQRHTTWLHRMLARLDPVAAARIHANDEPKLIRALEVRLAGERSLSEALASSEARNPLRSYRILRIGLAPERLALYARINTRAAAMFERGLIEETRELLARYSQDGCVPPASLGALGYRQAAAFLAGTLTLDEAVAAAQQGHRNYAKRQMTWFRREPEVVWLAGFGDEAGVVEQAVQLVAGQLSGQGSSVERVP